MASHILRLQRERPAHTAMYQKTAEEDMAKYIERRPVRSVSSGMERAGSPVTVRDGDFSSPDAPRGTGGPKSK